MDKKRNYNKNLFVGIQEKAAANKEYNAKQKNNMFIEKNAVSTERWKSKPFEKTSGKLKQ